MQDKDGRKNTARINKITKSKYTRYKNSKKSMDIELILIFTNMYDVRFSVCRKVTRDTVYYYL